VAAYFEKTDRSSGRYRRDIEAVRPPMRFVRFAATASTYVRVRGGFTVRAPYYVENLSSLETG
jgi:hypothetical protein